MKKIINKKIIIYVLIVILVLAAAYFSYAWGKKTWPFGGEDKYQAVRLISGDIYYGHLSRCPSLKLTDVYFVQEVPAAKEGEQPTPQLVPFSSLFFAPKDEMHLAKSQILWWADLQKDSQILKTIKEIKK